MSWYVFVNIFLTIFEGWFRKVIEPVILSNEPWLIFGGIGKYEDIEIAVSSTHKDDYIYKLKKFLKSSNLKTKVHFNAALYLKCLWEEMTYYTKIIKFKFIKIENHHQPKTIFHKKYINSKEIDKLSKWLLKPNSTFKNN